MSGVKFVLLFGCLALVAGRTIKVQKTSLYMTGDSSETGPLTDILRTFLGSSDVISGEELNDLVGNCSKGKCEMCKQVLKHGVCFVATLEKNAIKLEITLDKMDIIDTVIKGPNPPKVCKKSIPHIESLTDVCLEVKDVDLRNLSGCVYVSFKVSLKHFSEKLGCFKIPAQAGDVQFGDLHKGENSDEIALKFETS